MITREQAEHNRQKIIRALMLEGLTREEAEHNRQEIIRALMLEGLTREEATREESRRFQRALSKLLR